MILYQAHDVKHLNCYIWTQLAVTHADLLYMFLCGPELEFLGVYPGVELYPRVQNPRAQ